ncbi:DUF4132 domain-containing protein [Kitasatospora sp. NPDC059722]|uniref:DUF4132 domain-containing protein n=1 Tax=Kitasatospora sp. NPDC059722 TaxID=3346925 RepID=UPI0036A992FF
MRRWEFVADGSAKFWEAAVEGTSVRVRYGRIGTEGRAQVKGLGSAEAALAQLGKLVAEKERKGYAEVGTRSVPADADLPASLPDEDAFVMPAAWKELVEPRRGRTARAVTAPSPESLATAEQHIATDREWIEQALASPHSDPELVRAARAFLAGKADALGAVAVASLLPGSMQTRVDAVLFTDAWVVRHGLVFAARAVVEAFGVEATWGHGHHDRTQPRLRSLGPKDAFPLHLTVGPADRVRALLSVADEATYDGVVATLATLRTTPLRRAVATYLAPGTPGWADECVADEPDYGDDARQLRPMLLRSLDDPGQVERLGPYSKHMWPSWSVALVATLADAVGTACVPLLGEALAIVYGGDAVRAMAAAVARFPTDDAFRLLLARIDDKHVRPALQDAMQRYPVRATRLLAEAVLKEGSAAPAARRLLTTHALLHLADLPAILAQLDDTSAELVGSLDGVRGRVPDAPAEALPPVLVSPPWTRKPTPPRKARVLKGLEPDDVTVEAWLPGERESWAARAADYRGWEYPESTDWAAEAARVLVGSGGSHWYAVRLLMMGPAEELASWLRTWRPDAHYYGHEPLLPLVARYGPAVLPTAVSLARTRPASYAPLLAPFLSADTARIMADCLVRLKSMRSEARSWFERHGVAAALLLVPDAVGPAGRARKAAEEALRAVAAAESPEVLLAAVADRYGTEAAEIAADALDTDPAATGVPAKLPVLPAWARPALLPQVLLADGRALPEEAVGHVLTILALSGPGAPHPALATVVEACRADSLTAFAWALFQEWHLAGMPAPETWTLHALGFLGNDDTVRRLTPLLCAWPGQDAHHRAVEGLSVLAAIGSDVALLHLHTIAQRVRFKALKQRAQEKIAEVAEGLGLTGEQLSDRLVPDLGLDPDGTTVVDYGPRRFTVGFDEELRPYVLDGDGKRLKDLPAPGVRDDQELAPAERKRFVALKKEVRAIASDQIRRLEAAMVAGRTWTAGEFRELFVQHPLVQHLVRRLVWLAESTDGTTTAFRVTGEHSFADVEDSVFVLPEDATVRLPHPLLLGEAAVAAWVERSAAHGIAQPFPQLARPVRAVTPEEAAVSHLHRFEGQTVPTGRLLGLTKRGWERGQPQDAGIERWFSKKLGEDLHLVIALNEGIWVGVVDEFPDQTFETVWLDRTPRDHWSRTEYPATFGELDPVVASELLADLEAVTAP